MLIVVEGPDGSGKTTLIENLRHTSKRYFGIARMQGPPNSLDDLLRALNWLGHSSKSSLPIICDRHPLISERIYGPLLRGTDYVEKGIPGNGRILRALVDRVIYCRPPNKVILEGVRKEKQLEGVVNHTVKLIDLYDREMAELRMFSIPVLSYDWTLPVANEVFYEDLFFGEVFCG